MFERGRANSYSACGIPYRIEGTVGSEAALISRTSDQHCATGVGVRMRAEMTGIDLDRRVVLWRELEGGAGVTEPFDELVYAAGSVPTRPSVPGIDAAGVYGAQVLDDGVALSAELDSGGVRTVVVVGGGYIGLEIAEPCGPAGLHVTVVDRSATPVGNFDPTSGSSSPTRCAVWASSCCSPRRSSLSTSAATGGARWVLTAGGARSRACGPPGTASNRAGLCRGESAGRPPVGGGSRPARQSGALVDRRLHQLGRPPRPGLDRLRRAHRRVRDPGCGRGLPGRRLHDPVEHLPARAHRRAAQQAVRESIQGTHRGRPEHSRVGHLPFQLPARPSHDV
jgi:hypothetical protein